MSALDRVLNSLPFSDQDSEERQRAMIASVAEEVEEWWATRFAAAGLSDGSGVQAFKEMLSRANDWHRRNAAVD